LHADQEEDVISLSSAIVVLLGLAMAGEGQGELRWKLTPGETLTLQWQTTTDTLSAVNKVAKHLVSSQQIEMTWRVLEQDGQGNYQIEQRLDRIQWKLQGEGGDAIIAYDSAAAEEAQGAARRLRESLGALINKPIQLTLSPRGEILAVKFSAEFEQAIESLRTQESLLAAFSPEGLSQMFRQAMPLLPENQVKHGDSWTRSTELVLGFGQVTQTTRYTLVEKSDGGENESISERQKDAATLVIQWDGELQLKGQADRALQIKQQETKGQLWFDSQRGRLLRSSIRQQLTTELPYREDHVVTRVQTTLELTVR
jgi:hypothetical protein